MFPSEWYGMSGVRSSRIVGTRHETNFQVSLLSSPQNAIRSPEKNRGGKRVQVVPITPVVALSKRRHRRFIDTFGGQAGRV
jgi:hypothetical protein